MTGIFTGAKKSLFHKLLTKSDCILIKESIISETFIKFVGKTSSLKMSKGLKKHFKNKARPNKPANIISCP